MKKTLLLLGLAATLAGCASKGPQPTSYDFGPLGAPLLANVALPHPAMVVADVTGPVVLDTQRMHYRLMYADARQSRPYAFNSWSATPMQLLNHRLKARFAQAGMKVVSGSDAAGGLPVLRLEVDEFSQNFSSPAASKGTITVRASLFRNHKLVEQQIMTRTSEAPTADAAGGAQALAQCSDAIASDVLQWLLTLPMK